MKKLILVLTLLFAVGLQAQNPRSEKIKEFKIAFITDALDLSSKEAEKFWPIYNRHEAKMKELKKRERREVFKVLGAGINEITNEEAAQLLEKIMTLKTAEVEFQKDLIQQLGGVIPPKKILRLHKAEEDFKKKLLERFRKRRGGKD